MRIDENWSGKYNIIFAKKKEEGQGANHKKLFRKIFRDGINTNVGPACIRLEFEHFNYQTHTWEWFAKHAIAIFRSLNRLCNQKFSAWDKNCSAKLTDFMIREQPEENVEPWNLLDFENTHTWRSKKYRDEDLFQSNKFKTIENPEYTGNRLKDNMNCKRVICSTWTSLFHDVIEHLEIHSLTFRFKIIISKTATTFQNCSQK